MNIVIYGATPLCFHLATSLSHEEHNVTVIDPDQKTLEKLSSIADIATIEGEGTDCNLLEELLEITPQVFISLTLSDEKNIVACALAKNLGYPKTVARIRGDIYLHPTRLDLARLFFIDHLIGTEAILAHDIANTILYPGQLSVETLASGAIQMRTISIPENCKGCGALKELSLGDSLLAILIKRTTNGKEEIIFPKGNDEIQIGDEVTFIGETSSMLDLDRRFNLPSKPISSVIIAGGSEVAHHLCHILLQRDIQIRIIEKNKERCKELAKTFPKVTVLQQDATDYQFLIEQQVNKAGAFIVCTSSNEINILISSLAKQSGAPNVISLVSEATYAPLLERFGIDFSLSGKESLARRILSVLQSGNISPVAALYGNQAKILEIKISSDSDIVGIPISELGTYFPKNFLVALIENRGRVSVAKGKNILSPGDTAIVICSPEHSLDLERIF